LIAEFEGKMYESKEASSCKGCAFAPDHGKCPPPFCVDELNHVIIWIPIKKGTVLKVSKLVSN
jgi:hypothetical protein